MCEKLISAGDVEGESKTVKFLLGAMSAMVKKIEDHEHRLSCIEHGGCVWEAPEPTIEDDPAALR